MQGKRKLEMGYEELFILLFRLEWWLGLHGSDGGLR